MNFSKCVYCHLHKTPNIEYFLHPESSLVTFCSTYLHLSLSPSKQWLAFHHWRLVLLVLEFHVSWNMQRIVFSVWLHFIVYLWDASMLLHVSVVGSLSLLSNTPLYECATVCLPITMMDFGCKSFCKHVINSQGQTLEMLSACYPLRNSQNVFQMVVEFSIPTWW